MKYIQNYDIILESNMFNDNEIFNLMKFIGLEKYSSNIQISLFSTGVGAFLVLGLLIALFKYVSDKKQEKIKEELKEENVNA